MKLGLPAKLSIFLMMASPIIYSQQNDPFCSVWQGETLYTTYTTLSRACSSLPGTDTKCFIEKSAITNCIQSGTQPSQNYCFPMIVTSEACSSVQLNATTNPPTDPEDPDPEDPNPTDPDDPSNPIPDDLSEIRQPRQYTGAEAHNFSNAQYHSENSLFASTNVLLRNQNGIHQNNVDRLVKHDQDVKNLLEHTISSVNFLGSNFSTSLTNLQNSNQAIHKITHDNQAQELQTIQQFNDQLTSLNASAQYGNGMINEIWNVIGINGSSGGCGGFDCPPSYTLAQMLEINQQQLLDALSSGGSGDGTDQSQLLSFIEENTSSSSRTLKDIEDLLESIDEKTGTGGSDGGSDDDTETNFKLDIINDSLNRIDGTLLGTHQGLSMQLGQQLNDIKTAIENGGGDDDTATNEKLDGLGQKLDGIKGSLDGLSDTSGFADDLAQGTAQGKSDLNQLLDGYDADKMLTDRFKAITDEAEKTLKDSGLSKFSDPSKFIDDSGMVKPDRFDDLVAFAQRQPCSPYQMTIRGNSYQMDLCPYAADASAILTYVFAVLTAIFCFVMISQTLINERLS